MSFYIVLLIIILFSSYFMSRVQNPNQVFLSDLQAQLEEGKVSSVKLNGNELQVTLKPEENQETGETYTKKLPAYIAGSYFDKFIEAYDKGDIEFYDYTEPTDFYGILNFILIILLVGGMGFFIWFTFNRQGGDGRSTMNFGRSRAKLSNPDDNEVNFNDVAGADEEKAELQEVVDFLKNPDKYTKLGAKIPKGILLVGAPGTGKTLLAKAVAGEAGVPFFSISGSDFVEMFVGVGASRVRDMFDEAKKRSPSIIFIDEIDAVGRQRGAGLGGGHDEREQTLNQLLVEMDGFGPNQGVIVMAATNRVDILDPALLRPGRFDRRIQVMRPDLRGRAAILEVHAREKPIDSTVDLEEIAKLTPGFTGADLANLLNEAALLAARKNARVITYSDISEAVYKVTIGPEKKSNVMSEKERKLTAYHEAGHAVVLRAISDTQRVERVTIIPAGGAGGYTASKPHEDFNYLTKQQLLNEICYALGGRAAEEIVFGEISTGASSDLQSVNSTARNMITKYGMSDELKNYSLSNSDEVFLGRDYGSTGQYSEYLLAQVDEQVKAIIEDCYNRTLDILRREFAVLENVTKRLLEKEKIEGPEFEAIYQEYAVDFKPLTGVDNQYISEL
ncbi:MAG: ATP-dependent zinc metalloprotease FtsH, partial [Clostridiaceae bacterium]|nr:ATP-dependent zinc metalloprotease FtsH [Clostridiaceae bacterium]